MNGSFTVIAVSMVLIAAPAAAQPVSFEEISEQIESLAEGHAVEIAPAELERARELLRLAMEQRDSGHERVAEGLLALVPLQLRLIHEILRAAEAEQRAVDIERQVADARRRSRVEREALERALERMLSLTVLREED